MQLNPSAVLVPCVFPATGQAGQGGLYRTAGRRRAGRGSRGDGGAGEWLTDRAQRWLRGSAVVADVTHLLLSMSCVLAALIALMQKAAQAPRAVPSLCQPGSPGGKAATCGAVIVWRGLEVGRVWCSGREQVCPRAVPSSWAGAPRWCQGPCAPPVSLLVAVPHTDNAGGYHHAVICASVIHPHGAGGGWVEILRPGLGFRAGD